MNFYLFLLHLLVLLIAFTISYVLVFKFTTEKKKFKPQNYKTTSLIKLQMDTGLKLNSLVDQFLIIIMFWL